MKMITPVWKEKIEMGIWKLFEKTTTDENKLIRLAFHDCIPYEDGTGGQSCQNKALKMYMLQVAHEISHYINGLPLFQSVYIMANLNQSLYIMLCK